MLFSKKFCKPVLRWNVKTSNIEYYDIQYAAERTISDLKNNVFSFSNAYSRIIPTFLALQAQVQALDQFQIHL